MDSPKKRKWCGRGGRPTGINKAPRKTPSKPPTKTPRKKPKKSNKISKPFRLLDLPAELRNNVYEKVIEEYPIAHLPRNTARPNLATKAPLVYISKQIRHEFLSTLYFRAPTIQTTVRNFNFSHLITFMNRLDDIDLDKMISDSKANNRDMKIKLVFAGTSPSITEYEQLQRWINRVAETSKKGTELVFGYEVQKSKDYRAPYPEKPYTIKARSREEWEKIRKGLAGVGLTYFQ